MIDEISNFQKEVYDWVIENFPNMKSEDELIGISSEFGELCHHFRDRKNHVKGVTEYHDAEIKDAVGDMLLNLLCFCEMENINSYKCLLESWNLVRIRSYKKYD